MGIFSQKKKPISNMMKTVLFSALLALSAAKSVHMTLPRALDAAPKLLGSASDCECSDCGNGPDMTKCSSKQPQGMAILECWDGSKITCAKKDCKEWVDCIVKEFCEYVKKTKNPQGCADFVKEEFFDRAFNEDCKAKCDIFPLFIVIVVVVVVLLLAVAVFCYCKRKKAAAAAGGGGATVVKESSGGL